MGLPNTLVASFEIIESYSDAHKIDDSVLLSWCFQKADIIACQTMDQHGKQLLKLKLKLELLVGKDIGGGMCLSVCRYAETNSKNAKDNDRNK